MKLFGLTAIARYVAIALSLQAGSAFAQDWPAHQIVVVSPFVGGTTYDLVARLVLDQVTREVGQPFVLENRPGDDGSAGVASVVKAVPDGYTLLLSTPAMVTTVAQGKVLPYDMLRDLAPVALFGGQPSALLAAPGKGYTNVDALVAAAKANPGKLKFASTGIGTAAHLAGERFRLVADLNVQHVTYADSTAALNDLTAGRIDFYFVPIPAAVALAVHNKAVLLAVTTTGPWKKLPSVPTLAETGYLIDTFLIWCGLSAPANTPQKIIDKLNAAIGDALNLPAIQDRLERMGFEPTPMEPEQYGQFFADNLAAMTKLGQRANIKSKN